MDDNNVVMEELPPDWWKASSWWRPTAWSRVTRGLLAYYGDGQHPLSLLADGGPLPLKEPLRLHAYVEPGGELQMVQDKTMVRSGYPEPRKKGRVALNLSFSGRGRIHLPWRD